MRHDIEHDKSIGIMVRERNPADFRVQTRYNPDPDTTTLAIIDHRDRDVMWTVIPEDRQSLKDIAVWLRELADLIDRLPK